MTQYSNRGFRAQIPKANNTVLELESLCCSRDRNQSGSQDISSQSSGRRAKPKVSLELPIRESTAWPESLCPWACWPVPSLCVESINKFKLKLKEMQIVFPFWVPMFAAASNGSTHCTKTNLKGGGALAQTKEARTQWPTSVTSKLSLFQEAKFCSLTSL